MVRFGLRLPFLGLLLATVVTAQAPLRADKTRSLDIVPGAYIVEFEEGYDESSFYGSLRDEGLPASKRLSLNYSLFKGSSFQLEDGIDMDLNTTSMRIASIPIVKKVWPLRVISLPDDEVSSTAAGTGGYKTSTSKRRAETEGDVFSPHVMTQVDKLRAEGITGSGIRIGIIDTGVDYNHPALGGCFGEGCLISFGTDLVGDAYNGYNIPVPDPDPYENCLGHGTHVAGIIAARDNPFGFSGAAPGVDLGMYRVFGCYDNTATDVLIAAFNQAYEDGCDVITASIGGASGWTEDPWSVAVSRIVDAGVPCTLAAGNSGSGGLFYSSAASDGKGVTSVASIENTETPLVLLEGRTMVDHNCSSKTSFGWAAGTPAFPNITRPLWVVSPNVTSDGSWNACSPLTDDAPDLGGKIVLVEYSICGAWVITNNLVAKNAEYIMFYYYTPSFIFNPIADSFETLKGCGMVTMEQGHEWRDVLGSGKEILMKVTEPDAANDIVVAWPNTDSGGYVDSFSSWGPTWEMDVKPQIAAPGGSILSTWPLDLGAYAVASGTSMATPLTAAIYALLMEARGTKDPKSLISILSSTAERKLFYDGSDVLNGLAPVPQQGGGLIQAYNAAHTNAIVDPPSISFNDSANFIGNATFTITNIGIEDVTYELSHDAALTMYTWNEQSLYPAAFPNPIADGAAASLVFSENKIRIPGGSSVDVSITVTPPGGLDESRVPVYSGYVVLSGSNGDTLSIPYLGAVGSLYSAPTMLDPEWVFTIHYNDYSLTPAPANDTWTLPYPTEPVIGIDDPVRDMPAAVIQLDAGTPVVRCDIIPVGATNATKTEVLGVEIVGSVGGFPALWVPRRYFISPFTGMTQEGDVLPAGSYAFLVRVLKIFGEQDNIDDYDVFKMVPFNIQYNGSTIL